MLDFIIAGAIFFFAGLLLYLYLDYQDYKKSREFLKIE
jgi:hypothetical protein